MKLIQIIGCSCLVAATTFAGYTTPNTGVNWNLDSLVGYSSGTLTGTFPNYTLNDTLTIAANDRVTLRPGSVVSITQGTGKGFTVLGSFRAVGTISDSIIFKGSVDSAGWYRGFRIEDSAVDTACVISYCRIMNATEAVHCLNSSPTISNCLFTKNNANAVRLFAANPTVRNCVFTFNRQSAITANSNSSPLIENNIFSHNNYQNTGPRNAIAVGGQGNNSPTIRGNEIFNRDYFRAGAIGLSTLGSTDICNPIIENNYMHDNSFGVATTAFSPGGTIQPIIRYNRIENNRINPDPQVSGSGITMEAGGPSNAPIITGNLIKGNYWGITCRSSTGLANSPRPNIGNLGNADTSDDGWNIFDNNNNGGVIYQLYNNGTQDLFAQNNYWGSSDSVTVEQWIVHRPDSAVFGRVNYTPIIRLEMGRADSFVVSRISPTVLQLRWGYPIRFMPLSLTLMYRFGTTPFTIMAILPGNTTSLNWTPPSTPSSVVTLGLVATNRFGVVSDTVSYALTAVELEKEQPLNFSLEQNYPNPFNPTTEISYSIADAGHVSLKVYDLLGRDVRTLVDEELKAGSYYSRFDARELSSGIYFLRLQSGSLVSTKKVVLQR